MSKWPWTVLESVRGLGAPVPTLKTLLNTLYMNPSTSLLIFGRIIVDVPASKSSLVEGVASLPQA